MEDKKLLLKRTLVPAITAIMIVGNTISSYAVTLPSVSITSGQIEERTELEKGVDRVFGIKEDNQSRYGCLYSDGAGNHVSTPTLYTALRNEETVKILNQDIDKLKEYGESTFKDLAGHWSASYVVLPIYFKVLSGYEDNTVRPDNTITGGEVEKVIVTAYEGEDGKRSKGAWYWKYYSLGLKGYTYRDLGIDSEYFNKEMRRCEIAYILANYVSGGTSYNADISVLDKYKDIDVSKVRESSGNYEEEQSLMRDGYIPERYIKAIAYLVDVGVLQGREEDGTWYMDILEPVKRSEVFTMIVKSCEETERYEVGQFREDIGVEYEVEQATTPATTPSNDGWSDWGDDSFDGDRELLAARGETYEEYMARDNITARYDDPTRPRLKAGDTFIAEDGTAYVLEIGPSGVLGEGLPIATDLGRQTTVKGRTATITNGYMPGDHTFGWVCEGVSTGGQHYYVNPITGEGHWEHEWAGILAHTRPTEPGTPGQYSDDGNWYFSGSTNEWHFIAW